MPIERFKSGRLVRSLNMSLQVRNLLEWHNVVLVEELVQCTPQELLSLRGIGPSRLLEIRLALGQRGLGLADDPQTEYFINEATALPSMWSQR
jgi:DNA-directed RNA polymerase alpha subunit